MGVVADALLANPHSGDARLSEQHHRVVGDARPRPEQHRAQRSGWHVNRPILARGGDRIRVAADRAPLKMEEGDAVLDAEELV